MADESNDLGNFEAVKVESLKEGLSISARSSKLQADVLLDYALQTRRQILKTMQEKKAFGV